MNIRPHWGERRLFQLKLFEDVSETERRNGLTVLGQVPGCYIHWIFKKLNRADWEWTRLTDWRHVQCSLQHNSSFYLMQRPQIVLFICAHLFNCLGFVLFSTIIGLNWGKLLYIYRCSIYGGLSLMVCVQAVLISSHSSSCKTSLKQPQILGFLTGFQ